MLLGTRFYSQASFRKAGPRLPSSTRQKLESGGHSGGAAAKHDATRVHVAFGHASIAPEAALLPNNFHGSGAAEREKRRTTTARPAGAKPSAEKAKATTPPREERLGGRMFFVRVHPAIGRALLASEAGAVTCNLVDADQQKRMSGGRRHVEVKPLTQLHQEELAARRAKDFSARSFGSWPRSLVSEAALPPNT